MTCNCNRDGDVEYTITLNQQGPQGRQGNAGQAGFSPIIDVYSNTDANYQLKIITANGEVITPNLKGQTPNLPTGIVTANGNNTFRGLNSFTNSTTFSSTTRLDNANFLVDSGNITFIAYNDNELPINYNGSLLSIGNINTPNANGLMVYGPVYAAPSQGEGTARVALVTELDELADDVVGINSALGSLNFKKYTQAEYEALTTPDANTVYYVTDTDNENFTIYLGSLELSGGGGGTVIAGGIATNNISGYTKSTLNNISTTVTAEPYTA